QGGWALASTAVKTDKRAKQTLKISSFIFNSSSFLFFEKNELITEGRHHLFAVKQLFDFSQDLTCHGIIVSGFHPRPHRNSDAGFGKLSNTESRSRSFQD